MALSLEVPMYKVLITGSIHEVGLNLLQQEPDLEVTYSPDLPYQEILSVVEPYHCVLSRSETPITRELMDHAPNLKVIARAAVGIGNIDVDYATEKGILVFNTPAKNTNSAAELTLGLLLNAIRKILPAHKNMENLRWDRHTFTGIELLGKTMGIIGLGNVGHRVARFANAFDMTVHAYDPYISDEVFERHNAKKVSWDELVEESDVITLHVPKNKETTGMLGASEFARMKSGVIIINAARGGVVDEAALLKGIQSGRVAAAGVDTWEIEPPQDNAFREFPNVVMTPHIGASTLEAQMRIAESVGVQVPRALRGEVVDSPVNMPNVQVLDNPQVRAYAALAENLGRFASQATTIAPNLLELKLRGSLARHDGSLLRLSFLKGFLNDKHEHVSYVNADQCAVAAGLRVEETTDPGFTDYESALKCTLQGPEGRFQIGGVVFSGQHPRITLVNDFVCEIEPAGTILLTTNEDQPGMVGVIGTLLGTKGVNIDQFELARNIKGGEAMALIRVDDGISEEVVEELRNRSGITSARKISL